jgi:hypothetical protein
MTLFIHSSNTTVLGRQSSALSSQTQANKSWMSGDSPLYQKGRSEIKAMAPPPTGQPPGLEQLQGWSP